MRHGRQEDSGGPDRHRSTHERIRELETLNAELHGSEERFRVLFEYAPDALYLCDLKGTFVDGNAAAEALTGYARNELIGESFLRLKLLVPRDLPRAAALLARNAAGQSTGPDEFALRRRDGSLVLAEIRTHPVTISGRSAVLGLARDITDQRTMENALRERVKELSCLYGISNLVEKPGITLGEILQGTAELIPPSWQYPEVTCARLTLHGDEYATRNFRETQWRLSSDITEEEKTAGIVEVFYLEEKPESDEGPFLKEERLLINSIAERVGRIAERLRLTEKLGRMARHDPLTGVYNRHALNELLERELPRSKRYNHPIGLLLIDVNRFKEVNDRFGHLMGDEVLRAVADILQHNVRDTDIVARYGGDEFLVVLPETDGETEFVKKRILAEVARRNRENPLLEFPVSLAVGSVHWNPDSGKTLEEALAEADRLMYEDKQCEGAADM